MASLNSHAEKLQPALAEAEKKMGFDSSIMKAEFHAITEEPDAAKRAQRSSEFSAKYEPQFVKAAESAGIDLGAQRQQVLRLLDFSNAPAKEGKTLAIQIGHQPETPLPAAPADVTQITLSGPYTSGG